MKADSWVVNYRCFYLGPWIQSCELSFFFCGEHLEPETSRTENFVSRLAANSREFLLHEEAKNVRKKQPWMLKLNRGQTRQPCGRLAETDSSESNVCHKVYGLAGFSWMADNLLRLCAERCCDSMRVILSAEKRTNAITPDKLNWNLNTRKLFNHTQAHDNAVAMLPYHALWSAS